MKRENITGRISWIDILIIALFILAVYFILTRIFAHSASDLTITVTLFTLLGSLVYKLNREFGEFKIRTINSFEKIRLEIREIKNILTRRSER